MTNKNIIIYRQPSQGAFQIPAVVPVSTAIAEFACDCSNNSFISLAEINPHVNDLLHKYPAIKYANETVMALRASHNILRGVACGVANLNQIIDAYTAIKGILNKIEGAE